MMIGLNILIHIKIFNMIAERAICYLANNEENTS